MYYLHSRKGLKKKRLNGSRSQQTEIVYSIVPVYGSDIMGYKTSSENSGAVRASQPANEKQRLDSPKAESLFKGATFFFSF